MKSVQRIKRKLHVRLYKISNDFYITKNYLFTDKGKIKNLLYKKCHEKCSSGDKKTQKKDCATSKEDKSAKPCEKTDIKEVCNIKTEKPCQSKSGSKSTKPSDCGVKKQSTGKECQSEKKSCKPKMHPKQQWMSKKCPKFAFPAPPRKKRNNSSGFKKGEKEKKKQMTGDCTKKPPKSCKGTKRSFSSTSIARQPFVEKQLILDKNKPTSEEFSVLSNNHSAYNGWTFKCRRTFCAKKSKSSGTCKEKDGVCSASKDKCKKKEIKCICRVSQPKGCKNKQECKRCLKYTAFCGPPKPKAKPTKCPVKKPKIVLPTKPRNCCKIIKKSRGCPKCPGKPRKFDDWGPPRKDPKNKCKKKPATYKIGMYAFVVRKRVSLKIKDRENYEVA